MLDDLDKEKSEIEKIENSSEEKQVKTEDLVKETSKEEVLKDTSEEKELKTENLESEASTEEVSEKESKKVAVSDKSEKDVIDEIDAQVAEKSEKEDKQPVVEAVNYASMSLEEITKELSKLVKGDSVHLIKNNVNAIKSAFNKQFGAELGKAKKEFLDAGGNSIDFYYSNPVKKEYNSLLYEYKVKLESYYKEIDEKLHQNLNLRIATIEKLKNLIEDHDSETMYKEFKEIQEKWSSIGPVPRAKYNDTWRTYHHHVERFYDLLHLNNDLRDLDFKHNLEEKLKLIAKAEELVETEDINVAFKELQELHKKWKEDIGPVSREIREEVWSKFSEATKKIHDRRHDHLRHLRSKFEENVALKLAVIEEIKNFDTSKFNSHSHWQNGIKKIEELRQKFFDIGRLPKEKSDEIWNQFKDATKTFNKNKNDFYKKVKKDQIENLNKKYKLIERAEELKDSEDWDTTLNEMKKIQVDWKKIGHVPRKYSDKIWNQFKGACNHYFKRYHEIQDKDNSEQLEVFNQKKALLETFKNAEVTSIEEIQEYIAKWRSLGRVPFEMKHIEIKFNKTLDSLVKKLDIDKGEFELIKFRNIVEGFVENKDYRKIENEQNFIRKKIDETVREIQQLENNIGFVSNISNNSTLLDNVKSNIEQYKLDLKVWKEKLSYLREII